MARYEIRFRESVRKDLKGIPNTDVRRVLDRIEKLADAPRGCGSAKLASCDLYRVRVGDYRILYQIVDQTLLVIVVTVAHRRQAYR